MVRRVEEILGVEHQARQLHLTLVVAAVIRGRVEIEAEDRRLILGIVKEGLVINYMSVTLEERKETRV